MAPVMTAAGIDMRCRYLGLTLRNPLVASASPMTRSVERVRLLAEAGVGAVVLPSLFEEQLRREEIRDFLLTESHEDSFSEAMSYFPTMPSATDEPRSGRRYLDLIERAAAAVDIPVIASINGSTPGGWTHFARAMQESGAAAIELNIYLVPGDLRVSGREIELRHLDILSSVKDSVTVPVAVKIAPQFSNIGEMVLRLIDAGADGVVLFNRFLQPDVDIETLRVETGFALSSPAEARLPRTWIAILAGHVAASLAATTGVEDGTDVARYLLAGADAVMTASALIRHGASHVSVLLDQLREWMVRKGFATVAEVKGRLAVPADADTSMYERAGYLAALEQARATYGALV
jgi:dihydroorotate dehydrogenase (fumarate)